VIAALAEGKAKFVPDILVASGGNGGGAIEGLAATAMRFFGGGGAGNGKAKLSPHDSEALPIAPGGAAPAAAPGAGSPGGRTV